MNRLTQVLPWHITAGGGTVYTKSEAQRFARGILQSEKYREGLALRADKGDLPPAVEVMLWHYAFGKPVEHVEMTVQREDLSTMSTEQLLDRVNQLTEALEEAKALESAIPADAKVA